VDSVTVVMIGSTVVDLLMAGMAAASDVGFRLTRKLFGEGSEIVASGEVFQIGIGAIGSLDINEVERCSMGDRSEVSILGDSRSSVSTRDRPGNSSGDVTPAV
jgi:hypothetical protein